jgi:hypothetical protein
VRYFRGFYVLVVGGAYVVIIMDQGYDHVQAYLGICQKKLYVKKIYVKKIYVKKSRAKFLHFVYFSHVTSILGFTELLK